jgi:wyosine [tRNA(Phe)-imidazoG37] synthetase (radical SAM superfamily)
MNSYVFGPVPSRRLGRSLGVDLVPFKTCNYDCIYCQLGRTTNRTIDRREWVPFDAVIDELKEKLASKPDYITLSGSGEPTLFVRIGELIERIRSMTNVPVAVLTNGSLLWQDEVRRGVAAAQLVVPSLDAGDQMMFEAVNRPHPAISFEQMLDGLVSLRQIVQGAYWLEVFILGGYTADSDECRKIAACVERIKPDRVQLNTVTRPPAERYAAAVERHRLGDLAGLFTPRAEVIADYHGIHQQPRFAATRDNVLQMLERRPCSLDDIAEGLGIHRNEAVKYVEELLSRQDIEAVRSPQRIYYRARKGDPKNIASPPLR